MDREGKPARTRAAARSDSARRPRRAASAPGPAPASAPDPRTTDERLAEALEQQTATAEILRTISRSRSDVQPVFDIIAANALRLCEADFSTIFRFDGTLIHVAAQHRLRKEGEAAFLKAYPSPPGRGGTTHRAILTGEVTHVPDVLADPEYVYQYAAHTADFRATLSVPMLSDGRPIGTITVYRAAPGWFPAAQVDLLKTFADQAVIAIENVRLLSELERRNRDLGEALEQKTATAEVLRVIAGSPTDTQPVFDLVAQRAGVLCSAEVAVVSRFDGTTIELAAIDGLAPEAVAMVRGLYPMDIDSATFTARAIRTAEVVHVADALADPEYALKDFARAARYRAGLCVPIVRKGKVIGSIFAGRASAGLFADAQVDLLKTFADQAVIAIENVRLFSELEQRNRDLTEALDQQTATTDVLRAISRTTFDLSAVLQTLVESAARLCDADSGTITRQKDGRFYRAESYGYSPEFARFVRDVPVGPERGSATGRALLDRRVVHIPDVLQDAEYTFTEAQRLGDFRSILSVPMLREGEPIGALALTRAAMRPFTDRQIALVSAFADQAVIAIENVRLFSELERRNRDLTDALEQQTATSEILRVISRSPNDVEPVFATIAGAALELCGAASAVVVTYDGDLLRIGALASTTAAGADAIRAIFPRPASRDNGITRAVLTRTTVMIPDVREDPDYATTGPAVAAGFRSVLAVPLTHADRTIGAISLGRAEPGPFSDAHVALLSTFADQAVIAIENVRLFNELQGRNRDLTEALEQQTATSEILRVISRSPTDVQPVFDTIAKAARELCDASSGNVFVYDGGLVHLAAVVSVDPSYVARLRQFFPRPPGRGTAVLRAIATRGPVAIPDVLDDADYDQPLGSLATDGGFRSVLAVPLLRDGNAIGAIAVGRSEPGRFSDAQVALLQTFADQAVIAVENVRLFNELQARTAALTRSVGELRALGEVGQAVASTLDLETVLSTIVTRATELTGMDGGSVYEYDEANGEFHLHTADRLPDELVAALRATPMRKGEGVLGRLAVTRAPVQIPDILDERAYQSRVRDRLVRLGYRAILAVPLMHDDRLLGGLAVNRKTVGSFDKETIDLLKTFATQSALAIQNARLFRELEEKSRQLETASRHKSEFLANMSHELRTPLNAIIGFSEVLAERLFGDVNDKQAEYLADIVASGRHLLALINDILDLSKIEAGRMELDLSDFALAAAVGNTLALVRERAQRRGIALASDVDPAIGTIRADERKVKQVLLNLLSNALKFTPEGGSIAVRAAAAGGMVAVAVSDTGVGIAPEDQAAVFEEFRQVGAAARKVEGTGLGLAITRRFVELHGGTIRVESEPGKGSTFTFTLPAVAPRRPT